MYNAKKIGGYEYVHRSQILTLPLWVQVLNSKAIFNIPMEVDSRPYYNPDPNRKEPS